MRPFDADALIRDLQERYCRPCKASRLDYNGVKCRACQIADEIDDIDGFADDNSIDIEPKRGEWKPFDLTWGRSIWYCTACEESTEVPCDIWKHKPIYKYCPNCGADMREREGE